MFRHTVQASTMRVNLKDIEMGEVIDTGGSGAVISYWYVFDVQVRYLCHLIALLV